MIARVCQQARVEQPTAWNDQVAMNLLGFNFPHTRQRFLTCAEAKDILNFATVERRLFVILARFSEACWINSAPPESLVESSFRHICALVIDDWTSEQAFTGGLRNLPGVGKEAIPGGSKTSELYQLAERILPVAKSLDPSHGSLRKLCIDTSALSSPMDVSLIQTYGLRGLKSLTLHGSAIGGSFEVFMGLSGLQELDINNTKVDCSRALELISLAPWAPQIKKLGLGDTNTQGDVAALGKCSNLVTANLFFCEKIIGDIAALEKCTNLLDIDFSSCKNLKGPFEVFMSLSALQELNVGGTDVDCSRALDLISSAPWAPQIKKLALDSRNAQGSFEVFTRLPALRELNVSSTEIDCSRALELISSAPWAPEMNELWLERTNAEGDIAALGNCPNRQAVGFSGCTGITGDIVALGNSSNLVFVEFQFCGEITGSFEVFMSLPSLMVLNISYTKVDCSRALELISSAPWAPDIEALGLSFTNVQGDIAALGNCTNLEEVNFVHCTEINGDIAALRNCTNLREAFFIDCTEITGDVAALESCKELECADFERCTMITGDQEAIQRALPNCKIYF